MKLFVNSVSLFYENMITVFQSTLLKDFDQLYKSGNSYVTSISQPSFSKIQAIIHTFENHLNNHNSWYDNVTRDESENNKTEKEEESEDMNVKFEIFGLLHLVDQISNLIYQLGSFQYVNDPITSFSTSHIQDHNLHLNDLYKLFQIKLANLKKCLEQKSISIPQLAQLLSLF